ncbi:hypothetical protein Emed_005662 [Eimeria media]
MAKLKHTSQLRCVTWLLVLFLLLQQNQRVFASAGNGDGGYSGGGASPAEDVQVQETQLQVDASPAAEVEPLLSQGSLNDHEQQVVPDEDGGVAAGRVDGKRGRGKVIGRVALGLGLTGVLMALAVGAYLSMIQADMAFNASMAKLRRLKDVMPSAQRLFIAVDTTETTQLWIAIKNLIPELTNTLSAAEAKIQEPRFFTLGLLTGEYSSLLNRVKGITEKVNHAVAALHARARDELSVIADRITQIPPPPLWQLRDQLKEVLGLSIAEPYVNFVMLQEVRGEDILRAAKEIVERSNKRPVFETDSDEDLLLITKEDVAQLKRMSIARNDALTRIVDATTSCAHAFASTMRAEIMAAEQQQRMIVAGLSFFLDLPDLASDVNDRLKAKLDKANAILDEDFPSLLGSIHDDDPIEKLSDIYKTYKEKLSSLKKLTTLTGFQLLPEGEGEDKSHLRMKLGLLMRGTSDHTQMVVQQVQTLAKHIRQKSKEASKESVFHSVLKDFGSSVDRHKQDAETAAANCAKFAELLDGNEEIESLYEILTKGAEESNRAASRYSQLVTLEGGLDLLQIYDADVRASVALVDSLEVDQADVDNGSARKLLSLRDQVMTLQALAGNEPNLNRATSAAIEIRKAADLATREHYQLGVGKLDRKHRRGKPRMQEPANK